MALAGSRTGQYLIALAATAAAVLLRAVLDPWLGDAGPFSTLYGAVAVATWVGGLGAAVLAALSGLVVSEAWFAPRPTSLAAVITYAVSCSIIIALGHEARRRIARARRRRGTAQARERDERPGAAGARREPRKLQPARRCDAAAGLDGASRRRR
ncbi:MAG TPA: DUF4118 domain-containing protein [Steroidobacteraceae bacterium]|nr:DUF4118 domain-containing protein [Steroidobacteraceae bacterium]